MLEQINCQTKIGDSISSLYASALYMIMAYMPPASVTSDEQNKDTVPEEKELDEEITEMSNYDRVVSPEDLNLLPSGINKLCKKPYTYQDKYYTCDNGVARVSQAIIEDKNTLVLSFRGTENIFKDGQDYPNFDWHYVLFQPLIDSITQYISKHPEYEQVLVTGHSLGGAMVEEFLHSVEDAPFCSKIRGITFGSAGSREQINSNMVLLNIHHDHDMVAVGSVILDDHLHGATLEVDKPDTPFFTPAISAHSKYEYLDTTKQILEKYDIDQTLEKYKQDCIANNNLALLQKVEKIGLLDVQGNKILTKQTLNDFIAQNPPEQTHVLTGQNLQHLDSNHPQTNLKQLLQNEPHVTVQAHLIDTNLSSTPMSIKNALIKTPSPIPVQLKMDTQLSSLTPPEKTDTIKALADDINSVPKGTFPKFKAYVSALKKSFLSNVVYKTESGIGDVAQAVAKPFESTPSNSNPVNTIKPSPKI